MLDRLLSRRGLLAGGGGAALIAALGDPAGALQPQDPGRHFPLSRDFDFLFGEWRIRHRSLNAKGEWLESEGRCVTRPILGGNGNFEDHVIRRPAGLFHASGLRCYDPSSRRWAIWWLDARAPRHIGAPMVGRFEGRVGTFYGEEPSQAQPTRVRFLWTGIETPSPRWEQAYSRDRGATWETNWTMDWSRA